jgi:hypothetical protein
MPLTCHLIKPLAIKPLAEPYTKVSTLPDAPNLSSDQAFGWTLYQGTYTAGHP